MQAENHGNALRAELEALVAKTRELLLWEMAADAPGIPASAIAEPLPMEESTISEVPQEVHPPADLPSEPAFQPKSVSAEERRNALRVIAEQAAGCTQCGLHRTRTKSVFARGSAEAAVAFVGEGPGFHEDQKGEPFVGPAGQLLDRMVAAMGLARDDVYVCNIVKCRPPENRTPLPNEAAACASFLNVQLETVAPRVIVALGRCATENLGLVVPGQKGWRGTWRAWRGIPVMPTYHPAFLLRSPEFKRPVWEDLQQVMAKLRT